VLSYAIVAAIELRWPGSAMPQPYGYIFATARVIQGWCAIIALIGIAERYWNRDHPWRRTLTEAVFPFYIIHQTVIVAVEWALRPYGLPASDRVRDPRHDDGRGLLGLLPGRARGRLAAAVDRAARLHRAAARLASGCTHPEPESLS
jgi:hypothetical protein